VRDVIANWLTKNAEKEDYYLITGDLGFGVFDEFRSTHPNRFFNAGVAEQSMMSMAGSFSEFSRRTFVYSIGNFASIRCLEQIRNDIAYMKKRVTIVSVGSGFSYGTQGYTHHAIEDIAATRPLTNLEIYSPCDSFELSVVLEEIGRSSHPSLLRLGRGGEGNIHDLPLTSDQKFPLEVKSGVDGAILFHGPVGVEVLKAIGILKNDGFSVAAISCPKLSGNLSYDELLTKYSQKPIIIVEENSNKGGLAALVLESLVGTDTNLSKFVSLGVNESLIHTLGSQDYLRSLHGLNSMAIRNAFLEKIK